MTVSVHSAPPVHPVASAPPTDGNLPIDPGYVRTRVHYEAMLAELLAEQT